MNWILRHLATLQGRIGTGLLAGAAAINFARPGSDWTFQWESLALCLATSGAWLVAEIQGSGTPYPHDVRLFSKIVELIDDGERHFLRTHEFHESFARERMKGLGVITLWEGAPYAFLDNKMQKQWKALKARIDILRDLIGLNTVPDRTREGHQTVHPRADDKSDPSERTREQTRELNAAASSVIKTLDAFETFGRKRLRV